MSETLRQRLLAAVFDDQGYDQGIDDDLVRDLALSSDAHGELVRLATVLAGLPGRGARAAEARLDSLLDHVSLVAAGTSAMARGSDVMRGVAEPQRASPADPRTPSDPRMSAGQRPGATPGDPPASKRIRVDRKRVLVGVAVAATILVGFLAWPDRDADEAPPGVPVTAGAAPAAGAAAPAREVAPDPRALVYLDIRVSPSTATIAIDDVAVDGNPFAGSRVRDDHAHRIRVTAPGYISRTVAVQFSANVVLDVSLERARVDAAVMSPARSPARRIPPPTPSFVEPRSPPPRPVAAAPPPPPLEPDQPAVADARVQLLITTNVPGSEIAIDDTVVGTTPLREPLRVRPGRHKITVMHEGYVARTRFVDLDAANAGSLEIALTSSRAPEAAPEAPPEAVIDAGGGTQPVRPIDPVNPYAPDR